MVSLNSLKKKENTGAQAEVDKLSELIDTLSWPVKCQPLLEY